MGMLINPYRYAAGGFSPTSISNLEVWLDASDTGTLYDATSGGSLVTNGNIVRRIEDKSGNARHFTQSNTTTTALGVRADSGLNGKTTLDSQSGASSRVGYSSTFSLSLSEQTVIMVYKWASTSGSSIANARWFAQMDASGNDTSFSNAVQLYGSTSTTARFQVYADGAARASISTGVLNTWGRRSLIIDSSGLTHNWVSQSVTYAYTQASVSYSQFAVLGRPGTSFTAPYQFAELLMYSRALDATELSDIDDYITDKWGSGLV